MGSREKCAMEGLAPPSSGREIVDARGLDQSQASNLLSLLKGEPHHLAPGAPPAPYAWMLTSSDMRGPQAEATRHSSTTVAQATTHSTIGAVA